MSLDVLVSQIYDSWLEPVTVFIKSNVMNLLVLQLMIHFTSSVHGAGASGRESSLTFLLTNKI